MEIEIENVMALAGILNNVNVDPRERLKAAMDMLDRAGYGSIKEEASEEEIIAEAITKAKKAFEDCLLEKHNIDPAYFKLTLIVDCLDASFKESLKRTTFEHEPWLGEGKD